MIKLQRTITVESFEVSGVIAIGRDRPELLAIALLARDLERPLTPHDVTRELLGSVSPLIGSKLLSLCQAIGLLDAAGALSDAGRSALASNEVMVPEEGAWRVFYTHDPLVVPSVLHVERFETPKAKEEVRTPSHATPPALLGLAANRSITRSRHWFHLDALAPRGMPALQSTLVLQLEWPDEGPPSLRLSGRQSAQLPAIDTELLLPPMLAEADRNRVWWALVGAATGHPAAVIDAWRSITKDAVVPLSYASQESDDNVLRTLTKSFDVPAIDLGPLGRFERSRLDTVRVAPHTLEDAKAWAGWRTWDGIERYVTQADLVQIAARAAKLEPHALTPMTPDDILAHALGVSDEATAKHVLAPYDLGLWS